MVTRQLHKSKSRRVGATSKRRRLGAGRSDTPGGSFPSPPSRSEVPVGYAEALAAIKQRIRTTRLRIVFAANSSLVLLYWDIGRMILARQHREGWGAKVIDRLSVDLRAAYPEMGGLSPRNLLFMRSFAEACPDAKKVKQLVSRLPWGHVIRLFQRIKDPAQRDWYARRCLEEGWSRAILEMHIDGKAHLRHGRAISNFAATMPAADSDLATQVFKDPYLFDFLGTAIPRRERELEQTLVDHIQRFLLELGGGFAFVGKQVHLECQGHDYYLDLLFYHLVLRRYVVIELKVVPFDPAFVGTMNAYLSAVDDLLRHPDDRPTIGLLLCRSKDRIVVEYALRDLAKPIGVAGWKTGLVESLPQELAASLPTVGQIEAELLPNRRRR